MQRVSWFQQLMSVDAINLIKSAMLCIKTFNHEQQAAVGYINFTSSSMEKSLCSKITEMGYRQILTAIGPPYDAVAFDDTLLNFAAWESNHGPYPPIALSLPQRQKVARPRLRVFIYSIVGKNVKAFYA